jgi:hypothetical protein
MFTINVSYIIEIAVLGNTHIFNEFHHLKLEHGTLLSGITHPTESTCESSPQIQLPTKSGPITSYIVQKMHLLSQVFCDYTIHGPDRNGKWSKRTKTCPQIYKNKMLASIDYPLERHTRHAAKS